MAPTSEEPTQISPGLTSTLPSRKLIRNSPSLTQRYCQKFRSLFGQQCKSGYFRIQRTADGIRKHQFCKTPGYGDADTGHGQHVRMTFSQPVLKRLPGTMKLLSYPIQPRLMLFFYRSETLFVHKLHRFFTGSQGESGKMQISQVFRSGR